MLFVMVPTGILLFASMWVVGAVPPLLDGRRQRVHERVHLRRQYHDAVPDRHLRPVAAALPRLPRPDCVRLLLPGALHPRQARPARAAALVQFISPLVAARRGRASPGSPGASPCATTGAPADDRGRGAAQGVRAARRPLPAQPAHGRGRARHLLPRRARRAGRLHRAERRRQVDDGEDADRDPRPDVRATSGSPASSRRDSGSSSRAGSARCSASGSSSGGTCR